MEKQISHNVYFKELETALGTAKAALITNEDTTHNIWENAKILQEASEKLKSDKKKYLDKVTLYYENLARMSETASEVRLLSQKAVKMAGISAADEAAATKDVAQAAKSIEAAMETLAILSSDAAAINAKAAAEDANTRISTIAKEANQKGLDAAKTGEEATVSSLLATISAAKSNARFISDLITQFSANITALDSAITTTMQNTKANMDAAASEYQQTVEAASADELALAIADLNHRSAKEANREDNIKEGLQEAKRIINEEKKTTEPLKK